MLETGGGILLTQKSLKNTEHSIYLISHFKSINYRTHFFVKNLPLLNKLKVKSKLHNQIIFLHFLSGVTEILKKKMTATGVFYKKK